jgi:hypothetical protein
MKNFSRSAAVLCVMCAAFMYAVPIFGQTRNTGYGFVYGSLGTGAALYGNSNVNKRNDVMRDEGFSHIILSLSGGAAFILADPLYLTLGADSVLDFNAHGAEYANYLDFSLTGGIRIYPGLAGLLFSTEYCVGNRSDAVQFKGTKNDSTPWGNGFKFAAAYDFSYRTNGFAPIVGASWKHMPRGGKTYDDYLSLYLSLGFRTKK